MELAGGVRVAYSQFYLVDGWDEEPPLMEESFAGQVNGLCGARVDGGLFLVTGLHTGAVPVEVEFVDREPPLEPVWEEAVEVSTALAGPEIVVLGWAGESAHEIAVPARGWYRVRYCASGMDAGKARDTLLAGEPPLDRYRLQFWSAPAAPDAIRRVTSEIAAYWHRVAASLPAADDGPAPPHRLVPASAVTTMTVVAEAPEQAWIRTEPVSPSHPSWMELLVLMVHGPDPEPTLRGTISLGPGPEQRHRVWRDGARWRVESLDGEVQLIAGDETVWRFEPGSDRPLALPRRPDRAHEARVDLLVRREPHSFLGEDFTRPIGPIGSTTCLDRPAWTVELAPPPHKPGPLQVVVDAATGIVLRQGNDGGGVVQEWTEIVTGEPVDPALFTWTGPTEALRDRLAADDDARQAAADRDREWFARHVTDQPLTIEIAVDVMLLQHDSATGAFEASLGTVGALARRPRSDEPWDPGWSEIHTRWSTDRWDWALTFFDGAPTTSGLSAIRRSLGG